MRKLLLMFVSIVLGWSASTTITLGQSPILDDISNLPVISSPSDIPPLRTLASSNARFSRNSLSQESSVYRLANCDITNEQAPCLVSRFVHTVQHFGIAPNYTFEPGLATNTVSYTHIQQCGYTIRSAANIVVAQLQQNVNITYHNGQTATTPATLNWGDLRGTWAGVGMTWQNLSGPNPSPSFGNVAWSSASSTAQATLENFLGSTNVVYTTRMTIDQNGTTCS